MSLSRSLAVAAVVLFALAGCSGSPTAPEDYEFGRTDVYVRDTAGQPIDGVGVRLDRLNGQVEEAGGPTGSAGLPGYYFFLKTEGNYRVVITVPAGYVLADGQSATVPVTFTKDVTRTIHFVLRRL
jgi:hypothetical protein